MTQQELFLILKTTDYPVVYHSFEASGITQIPKPPYIVYLFDQSNNLSADNKVYHKTNDFNIELYTNKKDTLAESKLETKLDEANIFYDKIETYIKEEKLYLIAYSINT